MKKIVLTCLVALPLLASLQSSAQDKKTDDKKKKYHISITTEENGKTEKIDTTFDANDQEAMDRFLEAHGMESPPTPPEPPSAPDMTDFPPPPPEPPAPPKPGKKSYGYSYKYSSDENDPDFFIHINEGEFNKAIEDAIEAMNRAIESTKFDKDKFKKEMSKLKSELKDLQKDVKKEKKKNKTVIIEKTGDTSKVEKEIEIANAGTDKERKIIRYTIKTDDDEKDSAEKKIIIEKKGQAEKEIEVEESKKK